MTDNTRPVLNLINLVVGDMTAMVEFYRRLGLEIDDPPAPWDRHHVGVEMPGGADLDLDSLAFAKVWNEGLPDDHTRAVLGFGFPTREAVDATYTELTQAGYVGQQPPFDAFWGARYAIVEDPDGNSVGLMSPVDPAHRSPPTLPE